MDESEIQLLVNALAGVTKDYVRRTVDPLVARIQQLEARPQLRYMGVWHEDVQYREGHFVTRDGGLWHCNADCKGVVPGTSNAIWALAVKSGQR